MLAQLEKEGKSVKPKKAAAKPSLAAGKAGDAKAAGEKGMVCPRPAAKMNWNFCRALCAPLRQGPECTKLEWS